MKGYKCLLPIFTLLITCIAVTITEGIYAQEVSVIRIDPAAAHGGRVSDYFEDIEYIPLETTKESLFGTTENFIITDSSYIIGDLDTKSVYFFSPKGKLINRIKLPYENLGIDIAYEKNQNRIAVRSINWATEKGECNYYSVIGHKLNLPGTSINKETAIQVYLGEGYNVAANVNSYLYRGTPAKDSIYYQFSVYKKNKLFNSLLPFNQLKSVAQCVLIGGYTMIFGHPLIVQDGYFYAAEPLNFTTYKLSRNGAIKAFQFVLPADRVVPKEIIGNNNRKTIDSLLSEMNDTWNNKTILQINNIVFVDKYLSFKFMPRYFVNKPGSAPEQQYNFFYDTIAKKLISLERLTPDSSNNFLPVSGQIVNMNGFVYYNGYFYGSLSSLEMFIQWEKTKEKVKNYPLALEKYFKNENKKSNPVIVKFKLRKQP